MMEGNDYNLILFRTDVNMENAKLYIQTKPDTMLRVIMYWKPLKERVEIEPESLLTPERKGFTVVEWAAQR